MTMTTMDKLRADARAVLLNTDEFAETVTYAPAGGAAKAIIALVKRGDQAVDLGATGRSIRLATSLTISTDGTGGIAAPALLDGVTVDGEEYLVVRVGGASPVGLCVLDVRRITDRERAPREVWVESTP